MPQIEINQDHAKEGEVLAELCITLLDHWYDPKNSVHTASDLWGMIDEMSKVMLQNYSEYDSRLVKVYAHCVLTKHYAINEPVPPPQF